MFTYQEIETENQKSVFPRLYANLAASVHSVCGSDGERAVRKAIRVYAQREGLALQAEHRKAGRKQNTRSYQCASDQMPDSRARIHWQELHEEVCIKEVYTCPFAQLWHLENANTVGRWYCEEYEKAKFEAYTNGLGQMHLSALLMEPRNNNCRFAMYYRLANLPPEMATDVFSEDRHRETVPEDWTDQFWHSPGWQCASLYYSFFDTCSELLGENGVRALALGLKVFADASLSAMRSQAVRTLHPCNAAFAEKNFSMPLDIHSELYQPAEETKQCANALLDSCALRVLRDGLDK